MSDDLDAPPIALAGADGPTPTPDDAPLAPPGNFAEFMARYAPQSPQGTTPQEPPPGNFAEFMQRYGPPDLGVVSAMNSENAGQFRTTGGTNLTGEGVDPDFVYQPATITPVEASPLPPPAPRAAPSAAPSITGGRVLTGYATYYNLVGKKTAYGQHFDPDGNNAAMFQPGLVHNGDSVTVRLQSDPKTSVDVTINDTGPFARGPDKKALIPLRPDPDNIIDLTPRAFQALTGSLKAGKVPITVTLPPKPPGS
jgi:hypothetical protein